ncbi:MAG: FHA domain-containing protein [Pseudomonadota bacterium]|nr:FHA domain-containing protein [Pseudomonadota bacterium]
MKLLFPNGEHGPAELNPGITHIGSGAGADVVLMAAGIAPQHCEVHMGGSGATLRLTSAANAVALNGKQVVGDSAIKPGDIILFGKIGARVVASDKNKPMPSITRPPAAEDVEDGRTKVRQALPKFILRGVSGSTFGKNFALQGTMTVGRQPDCDICIPSDEVSRHRAKLQVMPDGIAVEDIGSANGTFVDNKRVHTGMLKPGQELRLDTVRFMLVSPALEMQKIAAASDTAKRTAVSAAPATSGGGIGKWVIIGTVLTALVVGGLFAAGVISL